MKVFMRGLFQMQIEGNPRFYAVIVQPDGTAKFRLGAPVKGLSTLSAGEESEHLSFEEVQKKEQDLVGDRRISLKFNLSSDAKWLVVTRPPTGTRPC